jgi:hypothetical protein
MAIDEAGRLCVRPASARFPFIWREAMEVHWDTQGNFLYSPKPREWSYADWFRQILAAAREQAYVLQITDSTEWRNIPPALRREIEAGLHSGTPEV